MQEWNGDVYSSLRKRTLGFQKVRTQDTRDKFYKHFDDWLPAELEGSDCKSMEEIGAKKGESYIKIGDFSFSAIKNALVDYKEKVRSSAPNNTTHSYLKSISFEGGALNGKHINFSPELNCFIGIRGSGKSSVLEAIRYCLGMNISSVTQDKEYKKDLTDFVLGSGGKVCIEAIDRFGQPYKITRILNSSPNIYFENELRPGVSICETVIRCPLYFGQKELASSSENFGTDLVEKLVGSRLDDIRQQIENKKHKIHEIIFSIKKNNNVDELVAEYTKKVDDAKFNLEKFQKAGIENKLAMQIRFEEDCSWIDTVVNGLKNSKSTVNESFELMKNSLQNLKNHKSDFCSEKVENVRNIIIEIEKEISEAENKFNMIQQKIESIVSIQKDFSSQKQQMEEEFAKIRRDLENEIRSDGNIQLNLDDFKKLNTKILQAQEMLSALENQKKESVQKNSALISELKELNEMHRKEFLIIKDELSKINSEETSLSIEAEFKGDKSRFYDFMKNSFRGSGIREHTYKDITDEYMDFADIYCGDGFYKKYDSAACSFREYFESNLDAFLTYRVPDSITIRYKGKELQKHSLGQRASALILLILSRKESDVIIIDQPEDDLDNQTIYNDVIKLIKKLKYDTQFIFATHNPNFPVLGGAELVHSCFFADKKIHVDSGTMDSSKTQRAIVGVMEGGEEAFRRRKEIYQLWKM